jgi:hypothetical protein
MGEKGTTNGDFPFLKNICDPSEFNPSTIVFRLQLSVESLNKITSIYNPLRLSQMPSLAALIGRNGKLKPNRTS